MSNIHLRFSDSVSTTERSGRSASGDTTPPPCDKETSDLFLKKLEERDPGRHDLESGGTLKEDGEDSRENAFAMPSMTSPLESLFSLRTDMAAEVSAPAADMDNAELEQLVERILVSTPEHGGHEVRLSLNSHRLPETEIVLRRDIDGRLSVSLSTPDASAFQTLVSSRGNLQQMLEKVENQNVQVTVSQETDREENDRNRRSRGYMQEDMTP